jgi:hypothetical protein
MPEILQLTPKMFYTSSPPDHHPERNQDAKSYRAQSGHDKDRQNEETSFLCQSRQHFIGPPTGSIRMSEIVAAFAFVGHKINPPR